MSNRAKIIFVLILLIGTILRFYRLDTLPPAMEWDEVATGYDAYSILKTGRDQFGNFLPLTMRSIDDYKPPLYTYLTTGSIAVLGWNDFAVRFPAALLGTLAVFTSYGMTQILFRRQALSLLTALFLAISPWHVGFSRLALETNSTIFFTTAGMWAFFKGLKDGKYLLLAACFFGLNLYLYHNARVFIPIISVLLLLMYWRQLWEQRKYALIAFVISGMFAVRLIPILNSIEGQMRFFGTSIFTEAVPLETTNLKNQYASWKEDDIALGNSWFGHKIHSEKVMFALMMARNYVLHFNPTFWLFTNDSPRHHVTTLGILYLVDLPFVYIGLYYLLRERNKKHILLIICWILLAPIPAAVTRDVPHSLRTAIFLPTFQILISLGFLGVVSVLKSANWKKIFLGGASFLYILNVTLYLHLFFIHYAKDTSEFWQYGRKEAAEYTDSIKHSYDRVIVSNQLEHPLVFFLYYLRYDPTKYLEEGGTVSGGWAEDRNKFDKYLFRPINFVEMTDGRTLFVGLPREFPQGVQPLKRIYYLNGKEAIWIVAG